ncbi:hypothetical protein PoB_006805800 [Plakobranchus ocellatus]|uniref:Uncharacterized protein n=1 Tax=Plakobranchus ocellatus TaxID=259542 RepID=A0AAV4DBH1_9GAST|nr:hypothetical protein PoB_006805800 [Plakobranchus ocellatus]
MLEETDSRLLTEGNPIFGETQPPEIAGNSRLDAPQLSKANSMRDGEGQGFDISRQAMTRIWCLPPDYKSGFR